MKSSAKAVVFEAPEEMTSSPILSAVLALNKSSAAPATVSAISSALSFIAFVTGDELLPASSASVVPKTMLSKSFCSCSAACFFFAACVFSCCSLIESSKAFFFAGAVSSLTFTGLTGSSAFGVSVLTFFEVFVLGLASVLGAEGISVLGASGALDFCAAGVSFFTVS